MHAVAPHSPEEAHDFAAVSMRAFFGHRPGTRLLTGTSSTAFALALDWQMLLSLAGRRIHNVDGANRFNVFRLADECLRRGVPPEPVLHSITVQRAFTPYQLLDTAQNIARGQTQDEEGSVRFFLSPCKQFFDGDVAEDEGEYLLQRLFDLFRWIGKRRRTPLVIVEREYDHPVFLRLRPELHKLAAVRRSLSDFTGNDQYTHYHNYIGETHGQNAGSLFHAD